MSGNKCKGTYYKGGFLTNVKTVTKITTLLNR